MATLKSPVSCRDHTRGAAYPKFEIIEYGDYQCPVCAAAEPLIQGLLTNFGLHISFTFRNFPLTTEHIYAFDAACAAEAAGKQGKYWEMHHLIFANQSRLNDDLLMEFAQQLGLDEVTFVTDSISQSVHAKIRKDFEEGAEGGVNGTPTFYIDGERFDGDVVDLFVLMSESFD